MIQFYFKQTHFHEQQSLLKKWLKTCLAEMRLEVKTLNYIFVNDSFMLKFNTEQLKHNYITDIITFDYRDNLNGMLESDIYICVDEVRRNSILFACTFEKELRRVMIHGILHLVGFNDATEEQKKEMRNQEEIYINI